MRILGIETSCDETAAAVVEMRGSKQRPRVAILSNVVFSQAHIHKKFGGVVPNIATREHQKNLVLVLLRALREAVVLKKAARGAQGARPFTEQSSQLYEILNREHELLSQMEKYILPLETPRIDAIAVTVGPGLEPALWAGVNLARALSFWWRKPVIPVNHLEGHFYTAFLGTNPKLNRCSFHITTLKLPAITLIVSGGHTELVFTKKLGEHLVVGETLDDAAGEAFDKAANMLGLGYPGGPEIAKQAARFHGSLRGFRVKLPRPMINSKNFDFSFSGLKTATLYLLRDLQKTISVKKLRPAVAKEFQNAVVDVLVSKTIRAARAYKPKSIILGGGVAANESLRKTLSEKVKSELPGSGLYLPSQKLTGDNALMIALAAYFSRKEKSWEAVAADANLRLGHKL